MCFGTNISRALFVQAHVGAKEEGAVQSEEGVISIYIHHTVVYVIGFLFLACFFFVCFGLHYQELYFMVCLFSSTLHIIYGSQSKPKRTKNEATIKLTPGSKQDAHSEARHCDHVSSTDT